jgi:hypothetical protein
MTVVEVAPRVVGHYEFIPSSGESPTRTSFDLSESLPREFMDELASVKGDGQSRISFSTDLSYKDFGKGPAAGCTVSIPTGSDAATFARGADLASRWSLYYAKMHFERAEAEFRALMAQRGIQVT